MPSHFSSIGFPIETEDEFLALARRAADEGTRRATAAGAYLQWSPGTDAELWVQVDGENDIIGANPHFGGAARMRVGLTARVARPGDSPLDGAFHGWADPAGPDIESSGNYPFVFDTPDFGLHQDLSLPCVALVQIAAFAHELTAFESEETYRASQEGEVKFAAESFIPSGLFSVSGDDPDPPQAYAIFTGRVLETALLTNPATGASFHWARVRTLGGEVDVVADPQVPDGAIVTSGILTGSFWLSGRIVEPADQEQSA